MSTATNASFDAMLRSYAPNSLFREEMIKRDWFLQNVERDDTWLGDNLEVRFKSGQASSVKFGQLTDSTDIGQSKYVRGLITNQPEVWGSLIFNDKDLMKHGKISEQNFLKLLPDELDDFMEFMRMGLSMSFTNGPIMARRVAPAAGVTEDAANGVICVDRPERLEIDQKFIIKATAQANLTAYVAQIDMETALVTLVTARGGATGAALTAYTVAASCAFYMDGAETAGNQLTSLKASLLSAKNGGTSTLYGQSKLASPYTQAINVDGSTINATNILDKLFSAQTLIRGRGKGMPNTAVCSYKHLGTILARLEALKGAYRMADDLKASLYGWTEVVIVGVKGQIKIVAIQEMDDDYIAVLDLKALKVYSNGFMRKRQNPDGREYFEVRNNTGYQYIVDVSFFGDMVLERPSRCGIIYGISY